MPRPNTPTLTPFTDQLPDVNNAATWATRTPLFWNWVTGDGYTSIADTVAYGDAAADYIDTALAGSETVVDSLANHIADAANPHGVTAAQIGAFPNIDVNGGNIDGTVIGATTAAAGTFTAITSTSDSSLNGLTVGRGAGDISTNTASGTNALAANTTGSANTASGTSALAANTTGSANTASGLHALFSNTTGINNTASGYTSLYSNTTGSGSVASGRQALYNNTTGIRNTASGLQALLSNTVGNGNVASGFQALYNNTTGSGNTALNPITSAGSYAPVFDPTTQNDRFCMGSTSVSNAYIQVAWTVVSDARDKTEIAPVPHGLAFVNALKPTSFRYKIDRDATEGHGQTRYGFLAQDILALEGDNPVIIDNEQPDKLRMTDQSLIAVMVNAIQEQQEIIKNLETRLLVLETK